MIPTGHALLDRVVADSAADPEGWRRARPSHIGASDAAKYAKVTSVESYLRSKLHGTFDGNSFTANGHLFEPAIVAHMGMTHNTRMFHHPEFPVFSATPDALDVMNGVVVNGEAKVKHKVVDGPNPGELRQVAFAQYVLGAAYSKWAWLTLDPDTHRPVADPQVILLDSLDLADVLGPVLEIAHQVAAGMLRAAAIQKEMYS